MCVPSILLYMTFGPFEKKCNWISFMLIAMSQLNCNENCITLQFWNENIVVLLFFYVNQKISQNWQLKCFYVKMGHAMRCLRYETIVWVSSPMYESWQACAKAKLLYWDQIYFIGSIIQKKMIQRSEVLIFLLFQGLPENNAGEQLLRFLKIGKISTSLPFFLQNQRHIVLRGKLINE